MIIMKEKYFAPEINVIEFEAKDIIQTSGKVEKEEPDTWVETKGAFSVAPQNVNIFED